MLAVRIGNKDEEQGEVDSFSIAAEGFPDFDDDTHLLASINFDDLFVGINDGDVLPDLEMDHELLAQFSVNNSVSFEQFDDNSKSVNKDEGEGEEEGKAHGDQEIVTKIDELAAKSKSGDKINKSSPQSKNSQGKRKVKVKDRFFFFFFFFNWVFNRRSLGESRMRLNLCSKWTILESRDF